MPQAEVELKLVETRQKLQFVDENTNVVQDYEAKIEEAQKKKKMLQVRSFLGYVVRLLESLPSHLTFPPTWLVFILCLSLFPVSSSFLNLPSNPTQTLHTQDQMAAAGNAQETLARSKQHLHAKVLQIMEKVRHQFKSLMTLMGFAGDIKYDIGGDLKTWSVAPHVQFR